MVADNPGPDLQDGPPAPGPDYNPIFERLVDEAPAGPDTVLGLVAYGLYKISKREWVSAFRDRHGRAPNDDELRAYIATWTPSQLTGVRQSAEQVLASYARDVIAAEEPRILRSALKGSFWRSVWPNMLAAALYTLVLIGIAFILAFAGVDLIGILRDAGTPPT